MAAKKLPPPKKKKPRNNPHGANQHKVDPRQALFLANYLDPKSKTFSNALQSALKAGYSQEYAESLTSNAPTWLSENLGDTYIVQRAEKNLKEFLEMDTENKVVRGKGENAMVLSIDDAALKRIKADMTKFALERLNKEKYSQRAEVTGKGGGAIDFNTNPEALKSLFSTFHAALENTEDEK